MQVHPPVPVVLPENLLASVVGWEDIKVLMKRGSSSAKPVPFLLVGTPASAKSLLLMELAHIPGAHYAVGSGVSKAGIRQMLIKQDPKLLIIDEMDKVHKNDLSVLLSLKEDGLVTETLYGRHGVFQRDTRVFAAANRVESVPEELLSRFCRFDLHPYDEETFLLVADRVLVERDGVAPELAHAIGKGVWTDLRSGDIRDAVETARLTRTLEDLPSVLATLKKYR